MQLTSVLARKAEVSRDRVLADSHQSRGRERSASFPYVVQHRKRLVQGQFGADQGHACRQAGRARPLREMPAARTTPDHADGLLVPAPSLEFQISPAANPAIRTLDILAAKVFDLSADRQVGRIVLLLTSQPFVSQTVGTCHEYRPTLTENSSHLGIPPNFLFIGLTSTI